jgi:two-component system, OmpR family, sensor kinase
MTIRPQSIRGKLTVLFAAFVATLMIVGVLVVERQLRPGTDVPWIVWGSSALVVLLAALGSWVLIGVALRPMAVLANDAARLSIDEPAGRLGGPAHAGELAELTLQLNQLLERSSAAVRAERSFVDDASHELRTPLAILRGELDLAQLSLAEGQLDHARASIASAADEARRLTRLADDLLVLARLDHGELTMKRRAVTPFTVIEGVVSRIGGSAPNVVVSGHHGLITGDPDRLDQVFTNLIANARRFARSRVHIEVIDEYRLGQHIVIADDGPGFPANMLPHAFDRFRRADRTRHRGNTGSTGLGLAIASAIVRAHGGTINAENGGEFGGAVVHVHLPLQPPRRQAGPE